MTMYESIFLNIIVKKLEHIGTLWPHIKSKMYLFVNIRILNYKKCQIYLLSICEKNFGVKNISPVFELIWKYSPDPLMLYIRLDSCFIPDLIALRLIKGWS